MIQLINVEKLKKLMDSQEEFLLIDCREQEEWDQGHIPGAKHIPLGQIAEKSEEIPDKCPVIIQCRSGVRSLKACEILLELGKTDLANLEGGILDWIECGYPTEK